MKKEELESKTWRNKWSKWVKDEPSHEERQEGRKEGKGGVNTKLSHANVISKQTKGFLEQTQVIGARRWDFWWRLQYANEHVCWSHTVNPSQRVLPCHPSWPLVHQAQCHLDSVAPRQVGTHILWRRIKPELEIRDHWSHYWKRGKYFLNDWWPYMEMSFKVLSQCFEYFE